MPGTLPACRLWPIVSATMVLCYIGVKRSAFSSFVIPMQRVGVICKWSVGVCEGSGFLDLKDAITYCFHQHHYATASITIIVPFQAPPQSPRFTPCLYHSSPPIATAQLLRFHHHRNRHASRHAYITLPHSQHAYTV